MNEGLTKAAARNIFYGGSLFFFIIFVSLTAHSHWYIVNVSTDKEGLTASVKHGKEVWEKHSCINCHSLLGEGAYFAPELGNVWIRFGGDQHPDAARAALKAWSSTH
jgi:nitric oxide reductase subunit C